MGWEWRGVRRDVLTGGCESAVLDRMEVGWRVRSGGGMRCLCVGRALIAVERGIITYRTKSTAW